MTDLAAATRQQISHDVLWPAARLAGSIGLAVAVVLPREPSVVAQAREAARKSGVQVRAVLRARSIHVRFTPSDRQDLDCAS